jgi:hypothetical protein
LAETLGCLISACRSETSVPISESTVASIALNAFSSLPD